MSNNNIMDCKEFFNKNNINWGYIKFKKNKNGRKIPKFNLGDTLAPYTPSFNPQSFNYEGYRKQYPTKEIYLQKVVLESQKYKTDYISYDTSTINSIDIDNKELDIEKWKKKHTYLLSKGKRLPHFFCKIIDKNNIIPQNCKNRHEPSNNIEKQRSSIDILTGQASYCKSDEKVVINGDLKEIDVQDIYDLANIKPVKKNDKSKYSYNTSQIKLRQKPNISEDIIFQIFNSLSCHRYENHSTWWQIGSFLKFFFEYHKALTLFKLLSSKSKRQKDQDFIQSNQFENVFKGFGLKQVYSIYVFLNWLEVDDNKVYHEIKYKLSRSSDYDEYEYIKEEFEKTHFHVKSSNLFFSLIDDNWICYNKSNFMDIVAEYDYTIKTKNGNERNVVFFNKWLKDKNKRQYDFIDFIPNTIAPKNVFNEFRGFELDDTSLDFYDESAVEIFLNHCRYLAGYDVAAGEYLINFICDLFKNTDKKPGSCIVIRSVEGVGKDLLIDIISKILGSKFVLRTSDVQRDVFGSSNGSCLHKIVLQFNELSSKSGYNNIDKIKDIITTDKILIRELYKDTRKYSNYIRLFIFSNNANPIKITETSRRFLVCEPGPKKDINYYKNLVNILENENSLKSILHYCLRKDLSNFDTRQIPWTQAKNDMSEWNKPILHEFLIDYKLNYVNTSQKYIFLSSKDLLYHFHKYCKDHGFTEYNSNAKTIKKQLKNLNFITYCKYNSQRGYKIEFEQYSNWVDTQTKDEIILSSDEDIDDEFIPNL